MDQFKTLYNKRGDLVIAQNSATGRYDVLEHDKIVFSDVRYDVAVAAYRPKRHVPLDLPKDKPYVTLEDVIRAVGEAPVEDNSLVTHEELVILQDAAMALAEAEAKRLSDEQDRLARETRMAEEKALMEFAGVVVAPEEAANAAQG